MIEYIDIFILDHTFGTADGWYIYMESSYPQQPNQRCRIISEEITKQKCIQFWYHMYGMDVDTLNIYIKTNGQLGKPVWTRSRDQGNLSFIETKSYLTFNFSYIR